MGLETKEVEIFWHPCNKKWYENKGYIYTEIGDNLIVKVEDLPNGSHVNVNVKCDDCGKILENMMWQQYKKYVKNYGKYYCHICAHKLYGGEALRLTKLKNGKSFQEWCIENNEQDILNRWDYKLNSYNPIEINSETNKTYWFKCSIGVHTSELKNIRNYIHGHKGSMDCNKCNSFAQWGIDNVCKDFLEKYWDYEKNTVDPWEISFGSPKYKVWIKCQEKDYHGTYNASCNSFTNSNHRCPYCTTRNGKVHPLDSLGKLLENKNLLNLWSDKNKKSPYEYTIKSHQEVWWKCPEGKHEDFYRIISNSNLCNFRCPECNYSKGEERINQYLINNNINYTAQKTFDKLIGINNGLLSYDFYLFQYNLLIEYQGEQHERYIKGFHKSKKDFDKQQEHDKRKKEYTLQNNIELLEIWYWDYEQVEKILNNKLN